MTELAHRIGAAHKHKNSEDLQAAMKGLQPDLPNERPYFPWSLSHCKLQELGMLSGSASDVLNRLGQRKDFS